MKLNATLLLQLINFILLYWILRTFFLRHALTFFFTKRNALEALTKETLQLEQKELKTKQNYTTLIKTFKEKIAAHEPSLNPSLLKNSLHLAAPSEKSFTPEDTTLITEQLKAIIEKECHHES